VPEGALIAHPEDVAHHEPDHARHAVTVEQELVERAVAPSFDVHAHPLEQLERILGGDVPGDDHGSKRRELGLRLGFAGVDRAKLALDPSERDLGRAGAARSTASSARRHHA